MARYFFHFRNGERLTQDEFGIEFDSADAALAEASKASIEMWSELLEQRTEPMQCAFEITDESGTVVFELPFSEVLERCQLQKIGPPPTSDLMALLHQTHRRALTAREDVQSGFTDVRLSLREAQSLLDRLGAFAGPVIDRNYSGATER